MTQGKILVISGPSGVGKDTVLKGLLAKHPEWLDLPTHTTRPPRPGEKEGKDRYFVSKEQFDKLFQKGEILERNLYAGAWYGVGKREIETALTEGKTALVDLDVNGAMAVKKAFPQAKLIFLVPIEIGEEIVRHQKPENVAQSHRVLRPQRSGVGKRHNVRRIEGNWQETVLKSLKQRLTERGQDSPQKIKERLKTAKAELKFIPQFDKVVVNPRCQVELAVQAVEKLVTTS